MGKASRGKRERSREKAGQWTAAGAARAAHQAKADTQRRLPGNPYVRAALASNLDDVMAEMHSVVLNSDAPEGMERDLACSMTLGKLGVKPPWPTGPQQAANWQMEQVTRLLTDAEVFVISPAAHAAVMAAAATLEPADVITLVRERDVEIPNGLLVLPEPLVIVNRTGSLSDTAAFGWQFTIQHQVLPTAQYPGVRVTTFMDRDGPMQPAEWRLAVAQAQVGGTPMPRFVPDGMYGMRGDGCLAEESSEKLADVSAHHRELQTALNQAS
ncbi:hypothetical protein [Streptomyces sp. NPDC005408]|uniref:hypothetical protein n=1 Tax=Streptomyces sp. NPDC005408 TaxID=3155341 RepID=UPI0033BF5A60